MERIGNSRNVVQGAGDVVIVENKGGGGGRYQPD